jgi:hypothetical protein
MSRRRRNAKLAVALLVLPAIALTAVIGPADSIASRLVSFGAGAFLPGKPKPFPAG